MVTNRVHPISLLKETTSRLANFVLAKKPTFAIIGTGRCGTNFASAYFSEAGVRVSHEKYYTTEGPITRNARRDFRSIGDASWLAVPFLPDPDVSVVHQVRHPIAVIKSFYNIGFFDSAHYERHRQFVDFAREHFSFSKDPLQSALRWYVEWNLKCEQITENRYQVEQISTHASDLQRWLNLDFGTGQSHTPSNLNSRGAVISNGRSDIRRDIERFPEFRDLLEMSNRYGYKI